MSVLLVTGTSGAGATTYAAAAAVAYAEDGHRTTLIALDGADGGAALNDILGPDRSLSQLRVLDSPATAADAVARGWFGTDVQWPSRVVRQMGMQPVASELVGPLPLLDDVAALAEVSRVLGEGKNERIVLDLGNLSRFTSLLRELEQVDRLVGHLFGVGVRVSRAVNLESDPLAPAADVIAGTAGEAIELLRQAQLRVVAGPEPATRARLRRGLDRLRLYGFRPSMVVIRAGHGAQSRLGAEPLGDEPAVAWPWEPTPTVGVPELRHLVQRFPSLGMADEVMDVPAYVGYQVERVQSLPSAASGDAAPSEDPRFRLSLYLPDVTANRVQVSRRGDDLLVDLDGHRRVIPLPSALRRCVAKSARLVDGDLRIAFEPDPALWPTT